MKQFDNSREATSVLPVYNWQGRSSNNTSRGRLARVRIAVVSAGCKPAARFLAALLVAFSASAADTLSEKLQRGLFEEEANHNLDAAIKAYQSVVAQSDEQRKLIATAVFRLGECYRKLGKTNEANAQYQRVLRDYSDQEPLAKLSRELLGPAAESARTGGGFGKGFKELMQSVAAASPTATGESELSRVLERRRAELQSELITKRVQWEQLSKLGRPELLKAAPQIFHDATFDALQQELNRAEQRLAGMTNRLGTDNFEFKAAADTIKTLRRQIDERLDGLLSGLRAQVDALTAQVQALDAELAKTRTQSKGAEQAQAPVDDEEEEVRKLRAMLKDSPDLVFGVRGEERLRLAAAGGKLSIAKFLLENKTDVNSRTATGETSLHYAAQQGHKSMMELLLAHGADVNSSSANGTPLHAAASRGNRALVELLLAHKAAVNALNTGNGNETPLRSAVGNGFTSIAELLLKNGADANAKTTSGSTPLSRAVESGSLPIVTLLLANKANPNEADNNGTTPLSLATRNGAVPVVEALLAGQADPNIADRNGVTPLHWAAAYGEAAIAELLLKHKASTTAKVAWASGRPAPRIRGTSQAIQNRASPLYLAVSGGHIAVVEELLRYGAAVNAVEQWDNGFTLTALHAAAGSGGKKEIVKLLLEKGADPDARNGEGLTPLMLAASIRSKEVIELLLAHGAAPNVLGNGGVTALSIASERRDNSPPSPEIAKLLREHGAIEDLQRSSSITVSRSGRARLTVFEKDVKGLNRFTLFEALTQHYANAKDPFAFPDFSRVKLMRLTSRTAPKEETLDLETAFKFGECAKDIWLEWGDLIEIPEQDHRVNERWSGLPEEARKTLGQCVERKVQIVVKGQTNVVRLMVKFPVPGPPPFGSGLTQGVGTITLPGGVVSTLRLGTPGVSNDTDIELNQHRLNDVIRGANVIRSSSDLTRIKVKRADPGTNEKREMTFNLTAVDKRNDLWLRNGDVIEIPEKE